MHGLFFFHIMIPVVLKLTKGGLFEATFVGTSASVPWWFSLMFNQRWCDGVELVTKSLG